MGFCSSTPEDAEAKRRSSEIENQLKRDARDYRKEVKLLLLGAGESGKSTIVKQMRIIHGEGYSAKDCAEFKNIIYDNIVKSMQTLVIQAEKFELPLQHPELADKLKEYEGQQQVLFEEYADSVTQLWADPSIQETFDRKRQFQLNDSAKYYFDDLPRISSADYVPNEQDVLRSRVATTGIIEYKFTLGTSVFRMVDVGGQRSERRKWIHCFEGVTSIVFVIESSGYDQVLFEDENTNRMQEALTLFDTIVNYKWFENTSMILFLNKMDILAEKLPKSDISKYFSDYKGSPTDVEAVKEFIRHLFVEKNRNPSKQIYPHYTTATDTNNIRFVFAAVRDTILQTNLTNYGLV
ncbi:guanine nucleotide-binding protein G(q) subunit alpha [Capsaspora owczarzaki ATCC 30864]|uniref:Guanine nucleotide-binding protein G(Q) subunit alpha n=1 Tax=Capsaspora owczarzaki (strain ATCC 30864) TaxID=595528 RepID=A0A0D2WJU3_CAPO3|nr:guanine nucleotide-binding protein G(q) subunit alpha [Capsaspora owczarzaki ATCC 30864]KJE89708.1 guanine nucleotide-binding protein G(q) subunit alpha [Capsaspora owczarzaki ATCC 30864]|eukprot:XP_004366010.1 guanine nucleotide-binding protein G(q) subunit alpha [Capsaspora owczarzaki ATCC 30864]